MTWKLRHSKGTAAVRGHAVNLLLTMLRRVEPGERDLEVLGDEPSGPAG